MSNITCGPAQDRPLHLAEGGVAIFKIFKIRVKFMYRHLLYKLKK